MATVACEAQTLEKDGYCMRVRSLADQRSIRSIEPPRGGHRSHRSATPSRSGILKPLPGSPGRNAAADRETLVASAAAAQADGFVCEMPGGYDSRPEQGGVNRSGEGRQRLSITRALASPARVMILDVCTSALDAVTEARAFRAITARGDEGAYGDPHPPTQRHGHRGG